MLNMEKVCAVAALVILGVTATDAAYGAAPPGSRGSIDFRFPNYIVTPRVPCPYEGVFPHPRNCSWYYRCYDRNILGVFNRAYFECEPGTVFSDALDQCVFGSVNDNCSPISLPYPGWPGGIINPSVTPNTPKPGVITNPPITPPGVVPDPQVTPRPGGVIQPVPIAPEVKCPPKIDQCSTGAFCPSQALAIQYVEEVDVCKVAELQCTNGTIVPFCPPGHFLSRELNLCFPDKSLCQLDPRPENYATVCEEVVESCWDTYICPDDATVPQRVRRCQVVLVCTTGSEEVFRQPVCGDGGEFDPSSNLCYAQAAAYAGCSSIVPVHPPPPPPQCSKRAELCTEMSLCSDPQQAALVCRQRFSCSDTYSSALRQPGYPVPGLTCVPGPDLPPPPPSCTVNTGECFMAAFCPAGITSSGFVTKSEVCRSAVRVCSGAALRAQVCEGQVYDVQRERCVSASELCGPVVRPLAATVCEDVLENCVDDTVCSELGSPQQVRTCDLVTVCYRDGVQVSRTSLCPPGSTYDAVQNQCIQSPQPGSCPPGVAPPATVPNCGVESETCADGPVCDSDDKALVCRRYFSCEEPLSGSIYNSKPVSPSTVVPPCEKIPRCEKKLAQCRTASLCPVAFKSSAFEPTVEVCYEAMTVCDDGTSSPICAAGQVYSVSGKKCIPDKSLCPMKILCKDEVKNCRSIYECKGNPKDPQLVHRCEGDGEKVCTGGKVVSKEPLCPDGGEFDPSSKHCYNTLTAYSGCLSSVQKLPTPPEPQCFALPENCTKLRVCNDPQQIVQYCTQSFSCNDAYRSATPTGSSAPVDDLNCLKLPSGTEMPEILDVTTTTSKPTSELLQRQDLNSTLLCTRDKEIPVNDDVLRINCNPVPLCNEAGMFLGKQLLCSRFYVCRWDAAAGHFYLEDSVCSDPTKLFSYESGSCVFPANACRI